MQLLATYTFRHARELGVLLPSNRRNVRRGCAVLGDLELVD
jgi:hypothetical protein